MMRADRQYIIGRRLYGVGEELPEGFVPPAERTERWTHWADSSLVFDMDRGGEGPPELESDPAPGGTIAAVKEWVAGDVARAQSALDAELAAGADARSTLIGWLRDLLGLEG